MADNADTKTLAELREAYKREDYHEDGAFSHDDMNAFHRAARALIAALEVQNAEQQRRIDALEAGLEPFGKIWTAWREYAVEHRDYPSDFNRWLHGLLSSSREHDMYQRAHDLLHADEKGGEG